MRFTVSSVSKGLIITAALSSGCLVGCSSSPAKGPIAAPAAAPSAVAPGKPAVKETPATVTVHGSSKKAQKTPAAGKSGDGAGNSPHAECSMTGDERKLAIKSTPVGGCEVLYTKDGKTNSIASAQHETKKCQDTFDKVKGNLEKAGFKCL